MRIRPVTLALGSLILAGAAFAAAAPSPAPSAVAASPGSPSRGAIADANTAEIHDLDQRIKDLRDQLHAQLDPLETQIKALREKFDPQIQALEQQRHDLVEAGKPSRIQDLDRQEAAELATLADQEKSEIERVHAHYADARRDVQARYKGLREAAKQAR